MAEIITSDLCVIGGGSAGLTIAAGASQMGAKTVLIERGTMGGDCLNDGCVPSKSLLAAARAADAIRRAGAFGIRIGLPAVDFAAVHRHVHGVIAAIAPNDSVERFTGLGVQVIQEAARFTGPDEVAAGTHRIRARRFVIATGSSAFVPPIPGLGETPYLTNETVFDLTACPRHLIIIGGGPIGCELAQAHRRLGSDVTIVEMANILPKDDPELVEIVRTGLRADGVAIKEGSRVLKVERRGENVAVHVQCHGRESWIEGSHLLLAVGRRANVGNLGLETAGIAYSPQGVTVDARLRSTNRRVYAAGDAAGGPQFTHIASHHAGIILRNALFRMPAKVDLRALPWVTFTDPEIAQVGLAERAARERHGAIRILRWPFADNDRAQTERTIEGLAKVITDSRGRILGAAIVGPHAGELIQMWGLAITGRMRIGTIAGMIAPYPTLGEINKRVAGSYFTPKLFSERTRRLVRFLLRFG